jgi:hypothetical protein
MESHCDKDNACKLDPGTRIARRRLSGVLCHDTFSILRLRDRLEPIPFALVSSIAN